MLPESNLMMVLSTIHYCGIMIGRDLEMLVSPNLILCTGIECLFDCKLPLNCSKNICNHGYRWSIIIFQNFPDLFSDLERYFKNTHPSP